MLQDAVSSWGFAPGSRVVTVRRPLGLRRRAFLGGLAGAAGLAPVRAFAAAPQRIVSLTPCLDVLLADLADPGQIRALSHYSQDPASSSLGVERARQFGVIYGGADEIAALRPDLVLAGWRFSPQTLDALRRLGVNVETYGAPDTIADSLAQVRQVARAVGRMDRGEAMVGRIRDAIARSAPAPGQRRLTAVMLQAQGFVAVRSTLMGELMDIAGFDNMAGRYGLVRSGEISLEQLLADPPDVLLAGRRAPGQPAWSERVLEHPALRGLEGRTFRAELPQQLTYCGGPVMIQTTAALARARAQALAWRP